MKKFRLLADLLTVLRLLSSMLLAFTETFSLSFYVLYVLCGVSDMLDGPLARKSGIPSSYGAGLDSIADIVFAAVCLIKIVPLLRISAGILILGCIIVLLRLANILAGFLKYGRLILLHTVPNKLTGLALFLLPLGFTYVKVDYSLFAAELCALYASVHEGYCILKKINICNSDN